MAERQRQRRLGQTLDVAGDEAVGGEVDDAVVGERRALDVGLGGVLAEMDVACGRAELLRHRLELVGGVGQRRQRLGELVRSTPAPCQIVGIGARRRPRALRAARWAVLWPGFGTEHRIAEADHRLCALILAGEHPQRLQARDRRQHAHRLALDQPGGVAIGREVARRLDCGTGDRRLLRHQQMERQRGERARRHDEEMPLVLDQRLDRTDQRVVKLMREAEVEQVAPLRRLVALHAREAATFRGSLHALLRENLIALHA